jgi:hypothetical protein
MGRHLDLSVVSSCSVHNRFNSDNRATKALRNHNACRWQLNHISAVIECNEVGGLNRTPVGVVTAYFRLIRAWHGTFGT